MTSVAVILCAGGSTRLGPLTRERPKALLDVGRETILGRAMRLLRGAGVTELVVATGYRAEVVRAAIAAWGAGATFCHNERFASTQNSVSLLACAKELEGRAFFKLDGDVIFHPEVLARLAASEAGLSAAVDRRRDLGAEEMKVITREDRIVAFGKGIAPALAGGESIGVERISADFGAALFSALGQAVENGRTDLYYEDIYAELVSRGGEARAVDVSDLGWIEVDTPEDLTAARLAMQEGRFDPPA